MRSFKWQQQLTNNFDIEESDIVLVNTAEW